ncbi:hypothetical protein Acy02nite_25450 [Actinoplanes cyaneus]|uniref:Uncharacterized protein n=1 Tax=Actinoplanes cyaneus TaxID=52696 RepID=A0A919IFF3_9ACTN|nr:hypothetical protein [Actinoplanes cyaneus]MCW2138125.1 hypothetical protein [Actinoplanes cyaneus]GID64664.1 hypothetical protein Acy02nite_25450 [Actinoplanes cyaneus]
MESGDELGARVREHLRPGEEFRAAIRVSKADGSTPTGMSRAEMSGFRFRRPANAGRRAVPGPRRTLAEGLGEHVRLVTDPRTLVLTDQRLMLLSRRALLRRASGSLRLRWECARPEFASATEREGRLRLAFTDGSTILLLAPAAELDTFLTSQ